MNLKLQELRRLAGYKTARDLADAMGVNRATLASWESGKRAMPWGAAIKACDLLGCTLDQLVGREPIDRVKYAVIDLDESERARVAEYAEFLKQRGGGNED